MAENKYICDESNFQKADRYAFRYQSMVYYWPPAEMKTDRSITCSISAEKVFGELINSGITPESICVIDQFGNKIPYIVKRNNKWLSGAFILRKTDEIRFQISVSHNQPDRSGVAAILIDLNKKYSNSSYKDYIKHNFPEIIIYATSNNPLEGLIDFTGPVNLKKPAPLIQMDSIFSARWNLWYEFAMLPPGIEDKTLIPTPINPLYLSSRPNTNATCFNMDDVPRFPLYYIRYYKATKDNDALTKAKIGLETIIKYTGDDGTMPYLLSPWDRKHHPSANLFDIYHSIRAVSEGILLFKTDKELTKKLISAYEKYRYYIMTHLNKGLFQNTSSANGAIIEAIYNRWIDTKKDRELNDIKILADALCTDYAKMQRNDFSEYIPWIIIGLSYAYQSTNDREYIKEAYNCLNETIIPSLKKDRRYYHAVPDFKPSGIGNGLNANPLQIWYHTDAMLIMHKATGDKYLYKLAAWIFGDYYDSDKYVRSRGAWIVDTNSIFTERWGSASAEDALRMIAKYLWQLEFDDIYQTMKSNANTSKIFPEKKSN